MKAKLTIQVEESQPKEKTVTIESGQEITMGRSPQCALPIPDRKLSRVHCAIFSDKEHFYVEDKHSTNGTYLNKHTLEKPEKLKSGDVIKIGTTFITFILEAEPEIEEISPQDPLQEIPPRIDDYEVIEKIGQGGIGFVYKVKHTKTQQIFAVKILKPEAAQDNSMVTRFYKEARACASLKHPAIVKIYDMGIFQESPYLVLEYIAGLPLSQIIRAEKRISIPITLDIAGQVADALAYTHSIGIVHRDIKPGNILVEAGTKVKIVDMGMVKMIHESGITLSGQTMGTPRYMPPEQIEDSRKVTPQVDIYALGATMYFMLAGVPPYFEISSKYLGELLRHISTTPPTPLDNLLHLPKPVVDLVVKAMERDMKKRFADANLMLKEIQNVKQLIRE